MKRIIITFDNNIITCNGILLYNCNIHVVISIITVKIPTLIRRSSLSNNSKHHVVVVSIVKIKMSNKQYNYLSELTATAIYYNYYYYYNCLFKTSVKQWTANEKLRILKKLQRGKTYDVFYYNNIRLVFFSVITRIRGKCHRHRRCVEIYVLTRNPPRSIRLVHLSTEYKDIVYTCRISRASSRDSRVIHSVFFFFILLLFSLLQTVLRAFSLHTARYTACVLYYKNI